MLFDVLEQVALASITEPSAHVLVVGVVIDGVDVHVHDGSFGVFVQSIVGGEVQLPSAHPDPFPPPDIGIDVIPGHAD